MTAVVFIVLIAAVTGMAGDNTADAVAMRYDTITIPPPGWHRHDPVQMAENNELFSFIDGGATLYINAGFNRAVFTSYDDPRGTTVYLEIYCMVSPAAAMTVHHRKAGAAGKKVPMGDDAVLGKSYLNVLTGSYQITVYGDDAVPETSRAIMTISRLIARRLASP